MALIDTNHQRAALILLLLGVGIAIALAPYATGLIGIPVLFAIFGPAYAWLSRRAQPRLAEWSPRVVGAVFNAAARLAVAAPLVHPGPPHAAACARQRPRPRRTLPRPRGG